MPDPYVLIGNSAAALAAVDGIRRFDRRGRIVLLNREKGPAYSRVALPYFVAGERKLEELLIRQPPGYERLGVELMEEATVTAIDAAAKQVRLGDGRRIAFGKLLVATGSSCVIPPIHGLDVVPHHYLWTLADAEGMKSAAAKSRSAVVIGGGFIGMLAAEALRKLDIRLTIVEMASQLLPQLLDGEGGRLFAQAVAAAGVTLRLGSTVAAVARRGEQIEVRLEDGEAIVADMIAVAAGVQPNLSCVTGGACATGRGVLVDEHLQTDKADVFAAGDVAEAGDFLSDARAIHAIWPTAVEQGRVAGANMVGKSMAYGGSLGMNVVELFDVTLAELGRFRETAGDDVHLLGGSPDGLYRKVVVDGEGHLVGALYVGDENGVAEMGVIHGMIKRRARWREFADFKLPRFTYATTVHGRGRAATTRAR